MSKSQSKKQSGSTEDQMNARGKRGAETTTTLVADPEVQALSTEVSSMGQSIFSTLSGGGLAFSAPEIFSEFLKSIAKFLTQAKALQLRAQETLKSAEALKRPTTKEEDEALQVFIKRATADEKEVDAHWTITALVSKFHRTLTGQRKKSEDPLEEAKKIAQGLHNAYVRDEKARVERVNEERLQQEAIAAQKRRDDELAELEQKAVEAEEASADLSDRERQFVELFANGYNTPEASARSAGFKDAANAAKRLLARAKIVAAVESFKTAAALRRQQSAVKAAPIVVDAIREEKPQIGKAGTDRNTWSAAVDDEAAFVDAACEGQHGIPRDCLMINPTKLRQYAVDLHEGINRWPGVRAVKNTTTV